MKRREFIQLAATTTVSTIALSGRDTIAVDLPAASRFAVQVTSHGCDNDDGDRRN